MQSIDLTLAPTKMSETVLPRIYNPPESTYAPRALFLLPGLSLSVQYQTMVSLPDATKKT